VTAYVDGLRMLARRELSEAQIRPRLEQRGHAPDDIDAAVAALKADGALNDVRVAEAIARMEITIRKRGRMRVRRKIEQAGIAPAIAGEVTARLLAECDPTELIDTALARRLAPGTRITDQAQFARLYRFLVGQGFESDRVMQVLSARRKS
jgi:regulatory protein